MSNPAQVVSEAAPRHNVCDDDGRTVTATSGSSQDFEDFIYLISHDVRSSARALLELPQWIAEDLEEAGFPLEGPVATSIELLNRHAGRLDRMLVDLLTFSRIGRMQKICENDINDVLDQVLEEIKLPAGFKVIRNLDCNHVTMGERDVLTMFSALISNAVKHHDKASGQIIVSSSLEGGDVLLSVSDDGPGIAPEYRERVFGAMNTLRPRDEIEGSGMGLTNVRKIANLYEGGVIVGDSPYSGGLNVEVRINAFLVAD
ncbi:Histidine kinase [Sulfitobacter noctilucicola]|uniref:histidine kinase n=1 Tax=Sulfitobacter noctilucicola TaxID=1342301 RepID=A0A7W6M7E5_9RHOB|nr:HAMP domain-containing sensor histidine kinase [Sulfitobacter noctilucicola]KIN62034.1 Histidine kinase [Sulfitobacter noctilucicola]MBB4173448.1 signal transduction histidine kinase [Sulfitobacter noctilucicola]